MGWTRGGRGGEIDCGRDGGGAAGYNRRAVFLLLHSPLPMKLLSLFASFFAALALAAGADDADLLPPDEAFAFSAAQTADGRIVADWQIAADSADEQRATLSARKSSGDFALSLNLAADDSGLDTARLLHGEWRF